MFYLRAALIIGWFLLWSALLVVLGLLRRTIAPKLDVDRIIAQGFGRSALKLAGIEIVHEGLEHLEANQPCVYVGNHQNAIDVMTFGSLYPRETLCIGKRELLWIPFFGIGFWAAGNVMINRGNRTDSIHRLGEAVRAIRDRGASIIIFPEGTRNISGQGLLPFKKGAFHMAIAAGVPIVPIVCSRVTDFADSTRRKLDGGRVRIRVLPAVPTRPGMEVDELSSHVRALMLATFEELSR